MSYPAGYAVKPVTALLLALTLLLAACAPRVSQVGPDLAPEREPDSALEASLARPAAQQTESLATAAWHRMQLGFIETGSYTTNVLIDLELPQGVRWTLEDFSDDSYRLRFTSETVPDVSWLVSPDGVEATPASSI